jgi:hypothetical protein
LHLILPPYYIKLCTECCTQQQPQLPHPCEEEIQISSFLSWNFQSTNPKKLQGVQLQTQNFQTHKSFFFSLVFWFLKPTPKKLKVIRNKTKDKSLQQVQQLDHLQQQQQIKLLLLLSFLSSLPGF